MKRCSPVEMRKNLKVVETLSRHGVDFVAIPVISQEHKAELFAQVEQAFEKLVAEAENNEERSNDGR